VLCEKAFTEKKKIIIKGVKEKNNNKRSKEFFHLFDFDLQYFFKIQSW